jgi:hypothetical protein
MKLLFAAVAALALAPSVQAQQIRCDTVMGRQFCTGPNGYRSTQDAPPIPGGRVFGSDSYGNRWTTDTDPIGGGTTTNNED